jgi:hypothetical protein
MVDLLVVGLLEVEVHMLVDTVQVDGRNQAQVMEHQLFHQAVVGQVVHQSLAVMVHHHMDQVGHLEELHHIVQE